MHPCGTIFFSSFRLMFRIFYLFLSTVQLLRWLYFCLSVRFSKIQKRPSHRYFICRSKKKYCHQIRSHSTYCTYMNFMVSKHCVIQYTKSMANCWSASNRITINDHEKYNVLIFQWIFSTVDSITYSLIFFSNEKKTDEIQSSTLACYIFLMEIYHNYNQSIRDIGKKLNEICYLECWSMSWNQYLLEFQFRFRSKTLWSK